MEDILRLNPCPNLTNEINLSLDGVQESKSSSISTDVYSCTFKNCRNVFPLRLIRPINRYKFDGQDQLRQVLEDLSASGTLIHNIVCDNPKRCFLKMIMSHAAKFGCEYCESSAVHVENINNFTEINTIYDLRKEKVKSQIQSLQENQGPSSNIKKIDTLQEMLKSLDRELKRKLKKIKCKHLCWPQSTSNGNPRTLENISAIVAQIEENPNPLSREEAKGIKGRSLLLNTYEFNLIDSMPAEYMHSTCLGVGKRVTELTFNVGQNRVRNTKRKRSDPKLFNILIRCVLVPFEFPRRIRNLDFGVFKAAEFRNIVIFFFTIVVECIEVKYVKERKLWLQLAFVVRACVLSNEEFNVIKKDTIKGLAKDCYKNYEKVYGPQNCTCTISYFRNKRK